MIVKEVKAWQSKKESIKEIKQKIFFFKYFQRIIPFHIFINVINEEENINLFGLTFQIHFYFKFFNCKKEDIDLSWCQNNTIIEKRRIEKMIITISDLCSGVHPTRHNSARVPVFK